MFTTPWHSSNLPFQSFFLNCPSILELLHEQTPSSRASTPHSHPVSAIGNQSTWYFLPRHKTTCSKQPHLITPSWCTNGTYLPSLTSRDADSSPFSPPGCISSSVWLTLSLLPRCPSFHSFLTLKTHPSSLCSNVISSVKKPHNTPTTRKPIKRFFSE